MDKFLKLLIEIAEEGKKMKEKYPRYKEDEIIEELLKEKTIEENSNPLRQYLRKCKDLKETEEIPTELLNERCLKMDNCMKISLERDYLRSFKKRNKKAISLNHALDEVV